MHVSHSGAYERRVTWTVHKLLVILRLTNLCILCLIMLQLNLQSVLPPCQWLVISPANILLAVQQAGRTPDRMSGNEAMVGAFFVYSAG